MAFDPDVSNRMPTGLNDQSIDLPFLIDVKGLRDVDDPMVLSFEDLLSRGRAVMGVDCLIMPWVPRLR
jgi:hypothetical protein